MSDDLLFWAVLLGAIGIVVVILGVCGDSWDARERRADARNRNPRP